MSKELKKHKKHIILLLAFVMLFKGVYAQGLYAQGLYAQAVFPGGEYWSLDAGFGTTDILVKGMSYQFIVDPKLWLSPPLMLGNKFSVNYSTDEILAFEGQVYLRWNFLRWGSPEKPVNAFLQSGIGMLTVYRGTDSPLSDMAKSRGSLMFDAAAGVTIPLTSRWHIEPSVRAGYPHIAGFGITAGYKFPLPQKAKYERLPSSNEIVKHIVIPSVDSIMFGPDTEQYNANIEQGTRELNEAVLNNIAKTLKENPGFLVRIEGHANPVTNDPAESDSLMTLSRMRADTIAQKLKEKGVTEEQMVIVAFGGAKTITNDTRNMNRRVELMVIQINSGLQGA
jgi:outer membrane protein OmpA-like peptidoglycan-associated protein